MRKIMTKNNVFTVVIAIAIILTCYGGCKFIDWKYAPRYLEDQEIEDGWYTYWTSYKVKSDDTLTDIASSLADNTPAEPSRIMNTIIRTNHILNPDHIESGTYIIVPYLSREYK